MGDSANVRQNIILHELPEFPRAALEALREPLESGHIRISRAAMQSEFPARFQLVGAMNPCPCGFLGHPSRACRDTPDQVARYQGKLSGPLLDRIDLHVEVPALPPHDLLRGEAGEPSAAVRERGVADALGLKPLPAVTRGAADSVDRVFAQQRVAARVRAQRSRH